MTLTKALGALILSSGLAACANVSDVTRNAPFETLPVGAAAQPAPNFVSVATTPQAAIEVPAEVPLPQVQASPFSVASFAVSVPEKLRVSEANLFYPWADIVWRGDPRGNRKKQIVQIFQDSLTAAMPQLTGPRPVKVGIEIKRFHSVTEKTRYTIGGNHSLEFFVTVVDAETGETLVDQREVKADLVALGGRRAMAADAQGITMKSRIQKHLARVLAAELTFPQGWKQVGSGLTRATDQI